MEDEFKTLMSTLKKYLKEKKVSYSKLAGLLGCSESSLKKTFTGKDCSVVKLMKICKAIDLDLQDLIAVNQDKGIKSVKFMSLEVEKFFVKNFDYFNYFILLYVYRLSIKDIKKRFGVDDAKSFKILRKLDEFNLVELLPGDKIKVRNFGLESWSGNGELMFYLRRVWSAETVQKSIDYDRLDLNNELRSFNISPLKLTRGEAQDFIRETKKLQNEYFTISQRRYNSLTPDIISLTSLLAITPDWLVDDDAFLKKSN